MSFVAKRISLFEDMDLKAQLRRLKEENYELKKLIVLKDERIAELENNGFLVQDAWYEEKKIFEYQNAKFKKIEEERKEMQTKIDELNKEVLKHKEVDEEQVDEQKDEKSNIKMVQNVGQNKCEKSKIQCLVPRTILQVPRIQWQRGNLKAPTLRACEIMTPSTTSFDSSDFQVPEEKVPEEPRAKKRKGSIIAQILGCC